MAPPESWSNVECSALTPYHVNFGMGMTAEQFKQMVEDVSKNKRDNANRSGPKNFKIRREPKNPPTDTVSVEPMPTLPTTPFALPKGQPVAKNPLVQALPKTSETSYLASDNSEKLKEWEKMHKQLNYHFPRPKRDQKTKEKILEAEQADNKKGWNGENIKNFMKEKGYEWNTQKGEFQSKFEGDLEDMQQKAQAKIPGSPIEPNT